MQKFVHASSSVYGDTETFPTAEITLPQPLSPYGATKLSAEQLVHLYWHNYGVPTISLRYFTIYGPRQRPDIAFSRFIRALLDERPITIFGDSEQTRDFTFVGDIVAANLAAGKANAAGVVCNIGGGSRINVNGILAHLASLLPSTRTFGMPGTHTATCCTPRPTLASRQSCSATGHACGWRRD